MSIDQENVDYLNSITERVIDYDEIRALVLEFILDNQIKDIELVTDLFVIGFLWKAHKRNEILSDEDLLLFLDTENEFEPISLEEMNEYELDPEEAEMTLKEILETTVKNHNG